MNASALVAPGATIRAKAYPAPAATDAVLATGRASQLQSPGSMFVLPKMFPDAVISRFFEGKMSSSLAGKLTAPVPTACATIFGTLPGSTGCPLSVRAPRSSRDQVLHCTLKTPLGGMVNCTAGFASLATENPRTSGSGQPACLLKHAPLAANGWLCAMIPWLTCATMGTLGTFGSFGESETFTSVPGVPVPISPGCHPQFSAPVAPRTHTSSSASTRSRVPNLYSKECIAGDMAVSCVPTKAVPARALGPRAENRLWAPPWLICAMTTADIHRAHASSCEVFTAHPVAP